MTASRSGIAISCFRRMFLLTEGACWALSAPAATTPNKTATAHAAAILEFKYFIGYLLIKSDHIRFDMRFFPHSFDAVFEGCGQPHWRLMCQSSAG
jgi:hypothetical protein